MVLQGGVDGPAKVADLEHVEAVQDVLRLDVAMDHVVAVQKSHSAHHLPEIEGGEVLLETAPLADLLEQAPVGRQLQQQVDLG